MEFDHLNKLQTEEWPNPLQKRVGLSPHFNSLPPSLPPSHKHTAMASTDPYSRMNERDVVKPKWTVTLKSITLPLSHIIQLRESKNKSLKPRSFRQAPSVAWSL